MANITKEKSRSSFTRLHSAQQLLICVVVGTLVYFLTGAANFDWLTHVMIGWDTFSLCLIVLSWITFFITESKDIRMQARKQESSRVLIFITILISTFASFFAVFLILISKKDFKDDQAWHIFVAVAGMFFAWAVIHTIFAIRYAHIFYGDDEDQPHEHAGGLEFPSDKKPDYLDFAYFSFVLGMTFQVSDVEVTSKKLRRLTLLHGILSFVFNTVMIALTINIIGQ
ncbi:MAG: DUF1345 domain-containing protein [Ginsengibacter sp.]